MQKKTQVFYVHGGMTFKNQEDYLHFLKTRDVSIEERIRWNGEFLTKELGESFHIIRPRMPLQDHAKYEEWKIHFERFIPLLDENLILIGGSLGGAFLAKYLSEHSFPKKILSTYLIAPPYDNTLTGEDLVGGFELQSDLSLLEKNSPSLTLFFSKDDDVVPIEHEEKFRQKLKNANIVIFESKNGHFNIPEFPEIVEMIKEDVKRK